MGTQASKDRKRLAHPPGAALVGASSDEGRELDKGPRGVPEQAFVPDVVGKPNDVEDSEEREPLNVQEAAAALPHWRQQVISHAASTRS